MSYEKINAGKINNTLFNVVHPLTWATSTGQIPNNLHYHKSGTTLPQNIQILGIHRKIELSIFLSKLTLSPGVKIPKREHPQFSLPIFLSSLELSWLSFNGITKWDFWDWNGVVFPSVACLFIGT